MKDVSVVRAIPLNDTTSAAVSSTVKAVSVMMAIHDFSCSEQHSEGCFSSEGYTAKRRDFSCSE